MDARPAYNCPWNARWSRARATGAFGGTLAAVLGVVETFEEAQVRELLDGVERVGEAAGPEFIPELANLRAKFGAGGQKLFLRNFLYYSNTGVLAKAGIIL
jgi:hypothetical protein